jgi:hypothetical protein
MPRYYCFVCKEETGHFTVSRSAEIAQVTRATVYNWMKRGRLHCVIRPSGRKFICVNSLLRPKFFLEETAAHGHPVMPLRVAAGA